MNPILKSITPFGITSGHFKLNLKKTIKNISPTFLVELIIKKNNPKIYTVDYLKKNYVSDLTEGEKWSLLAILLYLERTLKSVNYLEVGIYAGGTIKFLKENSKFTSFTGVDLFEDFEPTNSNTHEWKNYSIKQVWEALGEERVNLYKGDSVNTLLDFQKEGKLFDFIFIDGNHTYEATKNDFNACLPLLRKGGYVAFHNCSPGMSQEDRYYLKKDGGPWQLTIEMLKDERFQLVEKADRLKVFIYSIGSGE